MIPAAARVKLVILGSIHAALNASEAQTLDLAAAHAAAANATQALAAELGPLLRSAIGAAVRAALAGRRPATTVQEMLDLGLEVDITNGVVDAITDALGGSV